MLESPWITFWMGFILGYLFDRRVFRKPEDRVSEAWKKDQLQLGRERDDR